MQNLTEDTKNPPELSINAILDAAFEETGINNIDLSSIHEPLGALVDSLNKTGQLTLEGQGFAKQQLINLTANNIRIDAEISANPEILHEKIEKPLFIVGFPRTGSTLLHNLIAQPPTYRFPFMWEANWPSIYPDTRKAHSKERIDNAKALVEAFNSLSPELKAIHPLFPEGPDECLKLIENTFITAHLPIYFHIPDYWNWLRERNKNQLLSVYEHHKKQLQLLQWHGPKGTWVLKSPVHTPCLPELLKVYPDARIILLHRDPSKAAASFASLVAACRKLYSETVNLNDVGSYVMDFLSLSAERTMEAENKINQAQFHHIQYADLVKRPKDKIAGIFKQFDYEFTDEIRNGISNWLAHNPQNKHGKHVYTLEQYGLSDEIVNERLKDYINKYIQ